MQAPVGAGGGQQIVHERGFKFGNFTELNDKRDEGVGGFQILQGFFAGGVALFVLELFFLRLFQAQVQLS